MAYVNEYMSKKADGSKLVKCSVQFLIQDRSL